MRIECIRTHHLRCELDRPFRFSQWDYRARNVLLVEVVADGGEAGWGECYGPAEVIQTAASAFYAPALLGRDPRGIDVLWHGMWQASLDFARGVMMAAISGLDMALWDLKGKLLGLPVSDLMGGRARESVPCYVTGMYFQDLPESELMSCLIQEARSHQARGFQALKIKIGKNPEFDLNLIREMRRALPEAQLMADANHAYDLPEAARVGRELDAHDYRWFEEPLSPEHPEQYRQLQEKLSLPLAAGESEQTRYGFQRLLAPGGVQIAQPDLAYCGGPSEALKIRTVAASLGINVVPHVWGTMLNLAAAAHFLAAAYHEPGRLEAGEAMLECDMTENRLRDELFEVPLKIQAGVARVPAGPGLGVTIDPAAMRAMRVKTSEVCRG